MQFLATIFLAIAVSLTACSTVSSSPSVSKETAGPQTTGQKSSIEPLSAQGEQQLQRIIQSGPLSDLRSPNFSKHQASVKEFYEETGHKLGWSQKGKLTTQAREMIQALNDA